MCGTPIYTSRSPYFDSSLRMCVCFSRHVSVDIKQPLVEVFNTFRSVSLTEKRSVQTFTHSLTRERVSFFHRKLYSVAMFNIDSTRKRVLKRRKKEVQDPVCTEGSVRAPYMLVVKMTKQFRSRE